MQSFLTYGFLIPPRGQPVEIHSTHYEYCKAYIQTRLTPEQQKAFEQFYSEHWQPDPLRQNTPYTDFCIQVLDWCNVGSTIPKKIITFTGKARWHNQIYTEYKSYGFRFYFIPEIKLSTLIIPK